MRQFNVMGMSCAACSARVEKAVSAVPGVDKCAVSLLTNSMGVEGQASDADIIKAVEKAGYGAEARSENQPADMSALEDKETPKLKKRLMVSVGVLVVLLYITMGNMMFGWPLPAVLSEKMTVMGTAELVLTLAIVLINGRFFVSGFMGLMHRSPNMDTLVALGAGTAFGYSLYELVRMYQCVAAGEMDRAAAYMDNLYFESAAMILTLITVGKMLEAMSKGRTTDALKSLMRLAPKRAIVLRDEMEVEVPVEEIAPGDFFVVRPGQNIPVDGIVEEGLSAVNEAALTGESSPVDKGPGDLVSAATTNTSGHLICVATRVGEDTTLSQIIKLVSDAAATKAPIARIADKVSGIFVPVVTAIAALVLILWLATGAETGVAINFAICVLVISCPCALGLATPVAIMVGDGIGARNGILFKTAESLERAGKARSVILDKTGTVTKGEPAVTDVMVFGQESSESLLQLAYSLESKSEHPVASAISAYAREHHVRTKKVAGFHVLPGNGLMGDMDGVPVYGGNLAFLQSQVDVSDGMKREAERLAAEGKTPIFFARDEELAGLIAVSDQIKEDSAGAIRELRALGMQVVMLTGDNAKTAEAVGRIIGLDRIIAGVLPEDKEQVVRELAAEGGVIMVGDGINDAPALARADVGIAIGAGTDVAIDAADVVLMNSSLADVGAAVRLSRATIRNIHQNLFWAFIYNVIGIPLAAGVLVPAAGISLSPAIAAACMSLSSFCVVLNALRLNFFDIEKTVSGALDAGLDQPLTHDIVVTQRHEFFQESEENAMKKTLQIEGMMCQHCEARVRETLEGFPQVESAAVSHETDQAVITLSGEISDEELKQAVADQGYQVTAIE